jgi:hypothetical protein
MNSMNEYQKEEDDENEMANSLRIENEFFEEQKANIKRQFEKLQEKE